MQDDCTTLRDLVGDQNSSVRTIFTVNGNQHYGDARWYSKEKERMKRSTFNDRNLQFYQERPTISQDAREAVSNRESRKHLRRDQIMWSNDA